MGINWDGGCRNRNWVAGLVSCELDMADLGLRCRGYLGSYSTF